MRSYFKTRSKTWKHAESKFKKRRKVRSKFWCESNVELSHFVRPAVDFLSNVPSELEPRGRVACCVHKSVIMQIVFK